MPYLLLYLDFLVVFARSRLRSFRQTAEFVWVTAIRIRTGHQLGKGVELIKIRLYRENMTTLCAHVIPLIFQNLWEMQKVMNQSNAQNETFWKMKRQWQWQWNTYTNVYSVHISSCPNTEIQQALNFNFKFEVGLGDWRNMVGLLW